MAYIDGDNFVNGAILSYQQANRMKNNWRAAAAPANIQPGMLFSKSSDDKLYHAGVASAQEEVLQLSRSQDVSPTFLYETLLGRNLKTWWNFEDFIYYSAINQSVGPYWRSIAAGAGASVTDYFGTSLRPGIIIMNTGTTAVGWCEIECGNITSLRLGSGEHTIECDLYIETLSDGAETYSLRFGFGNDPGNDPTEGVYFEYYSPTSINWYKCSASGGVRTKTDTTIAAVAGAWTRLKVVVNADATSAEYFINGISVGVVTTNIGTGGIGGFLHIIKSAGINSRNIRIDWAWLHINLTATR